jgi:hypothetical protein
MRFAPTTFSHRGEEQQRSLDRRHGSSDAQEKSGDCISFDVTL